MNEILGAAYVVDFADMPLATVDVTMQMSVDVVGGGSSVSLPKKYPREKMVKLKVHAQDMAVCLLTSHKYVHRRRRRRQLRGVEH